MTDTALPFITADRVRERVSMADAVEGLDAALQAVPQRAIGVIESVYQADREARAAAAKAIRRFQ